MQLLNIKNVSIDYKKIRTFTQERNALFRKILYDHNNNIDLFEAFLIKFQTLKEIMKIKSAQQEATSRIELHRYIQHLRNAMKYIMECVSQNEPFENHKQLIYLHNLVDPEAHKIHPSSYRKTDVMFGSHEADMHRKIYSTIENLFYELEQIPHPVVRAVYAHHELVRIHPFADGNGRIARLVMNWILMYEMYPPMFIKTLACRKQYIRDLDESFSQLEMNPNLPNPATNRFFKDEIQRIANSIHFLVITLLNRDVER